MTFKLLCKLLIVWLVVTLLFHTFISQLIITLFIGSIVISEDKDWKENKSKNNK